MDSFTKTVAVLARLVLVAAVVFVTRPASAKDCGDNLAGVRVACACGDTVVSDTVLQRDDPVVRLRCPDDGLAIVAPGLSETLVLDLNGLSIVGSGVGDGITARAGGSEGAVIVGGTRDRRGEVVGFGTGINVRVASAVRRIEFLQVEGQRHEGLMLRMAGTMVLDVRANRNGGDGIRVVGQGGRLLGIEASGNAGTGIRLISHETIVQARVERNRMHGIMLRGSRNDLRGSVATDNTGYGILLGGEKQKTEGVVTAGNSLGGTGSGDRREQHEP